MRKLVILAVGVGVGFILGSRAGRGPYEKFSAATSKIWHDPRVQTQIDRTMAFANDRLEDAAEVVTTGTRNIIHRLTAPKDRTPAARKTTARRSSSSGTAKSGASKSGGTKSSTSKSSGSKGSSAKAAPSGG